MLVTNCKIETLKFINFVIITYFIWYRARSYIAIIQINIAIIQINKCICMINNNN